MARQSSGRPLERSLEQTDHGVVCPRTGRVSGCGGDCPFYCRRERSTSSVICSYPVLASDTFVRRARSREALRIALSHLLERT